MRIAADVGRSRNTIEKYLALEACPAPQRQIRPSQLDLLKPFLLERSQTGCYNARLLWEEVRALGYADGATTVKTFLVLYRGGDVTSPLPYHVGRRPGRCRAC